MQNKRYVYVIRKLVIDDVEPCQLSQELGVTTANLYNIKRRAMLALTEAALKDIKHYGKNKKTDNISDELLAAFLDGNVTGEEAAQVLDAMQADSTLRETLEVALNMDMEERAMMDKDLPMSKWRLKAELTYVAYTVRHTYSTGMALSPASRPLSIQPVRTTGLQTVARRCMP